MKKISTLVTAAILCIIFTSCIGQKSRLILVSENNCAVRVITDMAGRSVTVSKEINKIYSTGQPGVVMLYTLCPDKLIGWCLKLSDEEAEYINPEYLGLPVLGLMQGSNDTALKEEIMSRSPDIILLMTEISDDTVKTADEIEYIMNIPVVVADYELEKLPETYTFLGELFGKSERAGELSAYCSDVLSMAKDTAQGISESDRLNVYYAQGSKGLQTAPEGSSHSQVIDIVGGRNIVKLDAESDGRLSVNMEQVLSWNPDVVIASYSMGHIGKNNLDGNGVFSIITNASDTWNYVKAVQNNMVFTVPCYPYNWLDMPPSVNRIIGIEWLGNLLYPDYYNYDIKEKIREFYSIFYNVQLNEEQIDSLLYNAYR